MALMKLSIAIIILTFSSYDIVASSGLQYGFYKQTCPAVEHIVFKTVASYFADDNTIAAPVLRMHFHDCFVRGCDGSVLLNSTKTSTAEKDAIPNQTLDGFFVIDAAKAKLEKKCPGIVSCADILALAARDSVYLTKGLHYQVQTGRRDGTVSLEIDARTNLPPPIFNFTSLKDRFASKGLSVKDLAVLSGAHTIGQAHCPSIANRINNGTVDPTLNPSYAKKLRKLCKPGDTTTTLDMDPPSPTKFDNDYYKLVVEHKGLFTSDAALLTDPESASFVHLFVASQSQFLKDFAVSMVKMGSIQVLTGTEGEIRKNCALVN